MYRLAKAHFKKADPKLHAAALLHDIPDLTVTDDLFRDIVWTIIGQQLSGKAADTIFGRFEALLPGKTVEPVAILALNDADMRGAGLSGAKSRAIRNLSEKVLAGEVSLERISKMSDAEVATELTKVKGIGPWTAEMVLMFSLGRTDVFSVGDLGLRKGIMHLYGLKKMPDDNKMSRLTASWSPWRTYASRVLWRVADTARKVPRPPRKRSTKQK
jgi:DNA-3-methyladenine glycosylase II